jgi:tetratricopeptide (TPR) repeat protein
VPFIRRAHWLPATLCLALAACNSDPRAASRRYIDNGNKYLERGKYKEASLLYRRALAQDARSADAWYRLGLTHSKLALYGEARHDFARAADLDPANTDALVKLGDLDLAFYALDPKANQEGLADLKDVAARLLKRDKQSYDGLRFSAEIALIAKDLKGAIEKFEQANRSRPDQPELVLAFAQTLFADGQNDRAENLATDLIAKRKSFGPIYDLLYVDYLRSGRPEPAEAILQKKIANNPSEGEYAMQLAYHYYRTNRRADMEAALARLNGEHLQTGDFYARIGEYDRAIQQYNAGLNEQAKDHPKDQLVYRKKIIEVLGAQGKAAQALALVTDLQRDDPQDAETIALHATLLLGQRQVNQAIAELEPLAAKLARNPLLHYNLGRAYLAAGGRLDQARIQFQEALKLDPRNLPAWQSLAEVELRRGESGRAGYYADQVLNADPSNVAAALIRATALLNMSENSKAREQLNAVLQLNPRSNDARYELGALDLKERRYAEAEAEFQNLRQANDPRWVPSAVEVMTARGRFAEAVQLLDSPEGARALPPAQLQLRLGECHSALNQLPAAIAAFRKARELAPDNAAPDANLGILYERLQRFDEARRAYQDAIRKQPDNLTALNNLAYLDADAGINLDQALAYAQRVRAKRPEDPNVLDTLALICLKKNLTDDGLRMLRDAVSRKPDSATLRLHLALALYQKGDRTLARQELDAARRSKPTAREQSQIRELLSKLG